MPGNSNAKTRTTKITASSNKAAITFAARHSLRSACSFPHGALTQIPCDSPRKHHSPQYGACMRPYFMSLKSWSFFGSSWMSAARKAKIAPLSANTTRLRGLSKSAQDQFAPSTTTLPSAPRFYSRLSAFLISNMIPSGLNAPEEEPRGADRAEGVAENVLLRVRNGRQCPSRRNTPPSR